MTNPAPLRTRKSADDADCLDVAAFCALPSCGQEFRRAIQPGERQLYCGSAHRRQAQREIRQIRSRLRDLEATVGQQRRLLAAYGSGENGGDGDDLEAATLAKVAIERAGGIVRFLPEEGEPIVEEFRALYQAVAPLAKTN